MKKILFVDDEIQILKALKRLFLDTEYEIHTAESAAEASKLLEAAPMDMVVSDMRMPVTDGYRFLAFVKQKYPQTLRVMLSGYADEALVFNALHHNIAKIYIFKPWHNEKFLKLIADVFDLYAMLNKKNLGDAMNNLSCLSTLPSLMQEMHTDMTDAQEDILLEKIKLDPPLAAKCLKLANSSLYGVKTGELSKAVKVLGTEKISQVISAVSTFEWLEAGSNREQQLRKLWEHGQKTQAFLLRLYSEFLQKELPEQGSYAGLLHNLGAFFLLRYHGKEYATFCEARMHQEKHILLQEREQFRFDHQEIGGLLSQWWDLPLPMVEAAGYHHSPFVPQIRHKELVCAVYIAQYYASRMLELWKEADALDACLDFLGIRKETIERAFTC